MNKKKDVRVALIDMNNGQPNQGMRSIREVLSKYIQETGVALSYEEFAIRDKGELPGLEFDIYISSGGPGSPYDGEGHDWENNFFTLLDELETHNRENSNKKHVFLICHSFQLACRKYKLADITRRKSTAFGIFPVHLTEEGLQDPVFEGLPASFYSVDSRDWQAVSPDPVSLEKMGAKVLAIEKNRPHVDLERCVMAIRFTNEIIGTQFHPEADAVGMKMYLMQEEKKKMIIENHGEEKYNDMLNSLEDPNRISLTQRIVLPNFLNAAIDTLTVA